MKLLYPHPLLIFLLFVTLSITNPLFALESTPHKEVLVICPAMFRPALKPWVDYRTRQGYHIQFISSEGTNLEIRARIQASARQNRPVAILLIGDAAPPSDTDTTRLARSVPGFRTEAKINIRFDSPPHIGTDNNYADLDGDRVPDVPLGRLAVDTPEELREVVQKILAYESAPSDQWQRNVALIAGIGGFGPLIDGAIDMAAWTLIQQLPDHYRVTMTQAAWQSPFCPTPERFSETVMQQMNDGPLFWVYMGHGNRAQLDRLRMPQCNRRIMSTDDIDSLRAGQGRTIALMLACLTGEYDEQTDSLAEQMVVTPGGPVAVIASSRVAMPYSMSVLANAIMRQILLAETTTLGELFLSAKQEMAEDEPRDKNRVMIDQMAKTFSPTRNELSEERMEHLDLFNLFGDPLLKLPCPRVIELDAPETVEKGEKFQVSGTLPFSGELTIELIRSRRRPDYTPAKRSEFPSTAKEIAAMQQTYEQANQDAFHHQATTDAKAGPLDLFITVPPTAPGGRCAIRLFLTDGTHSAVGSREVLIKKKSPKN